MLDELKMNKLNTDQQISKLEKATQLANKAQKSDNLAERLGAFVLYAGFVDFLVIQAARLTEQIILKGQLATGKKPFFQPNDDSYFYDKKVSTRKILKGIRKFLPFESSNVSAGKEITEMANKMIECGFIFLNYRNPIVHQIGNPIKKFEDIITLCKRANEEYHKFCKAHKEFMEAAGPYRFGEKELKYFYG